MENGTKANAPHIAMLAIPGMGHLIPLAELAKLLITKYGFTATVMTFLSSLHPPFLLSLYHLCASLIYHQILILKFACRLSLSDLS
jgi:hypothetical protein